MLTAELVADICWPEDLHLAPDGRTGVYRLRPIGKKDKKPTSALWICTSDSPRTPRQFTAGTAEDRSPKWSPDGKQIAFLSDRARRGTAQLYLIDATGGEAHPLATLEQKRSVEEFAWSPSGEQVAFTSADESTEDEERRKKERDDARVYGERWPYARLRLASLVSPKVTTLVGGDRHITGLAWSPDGAEIAYIVRKTPALESLTQEHRIERVSVAGGEPRVVCHIPCGVESLIWTSDGRSLLFISSVTPHSHSSQAVFGVPLDTERRDGGAPPRRLAFGETSCALALQQPCGAEWAVVCEARNMETRLHWLDPHTGSYRQLLASAGQRAAAEIHAWSVSALQDGGSALAAVQSSGQQPQEIWMGRCTTPEPLPALVRVTFHQEALAGVAFGVQEPFLWEASDGLALDGLLIRPPESAHGAAGNPLPMIVLVHGGPYWRTGYELHLNWHRWGQWLALAGYAVLLPNYRGGMGRGELFAAMARGAVGKEDFGDVMSAVDAAIARGIADPERLGIGGWSQGGFMAAWAATQTARFKAAVMGAGVSDWGMMVATSDLPDIQRELAGSAPWEGVGPHRHAELSPISYAPSLKTPLLILHGEEDERVPVSQAIGFHRALRETGVPSQLVMYPREPHVLSERAHQVDLLRRIRSWYDLWLHA
jgi:dipeptidyl aminopeptidase/acylaminoacyl peptidase